MARRIAAVVRALPWRTCPTGLCEIPARKIHHHTLGLHGQNGLGLTPADVYALPARPDAVDTETGRWHLGELTGKAAKPRSAFPVAYRALADQSLLRRLDGPV